MRRFVTLSTLTLLTLLTLAQPRQRAPFIGNAYDVLSKTEGKPGANKAAVVAESDSCTVNVLGASGPVRAHYHKVHEETVTVLRGGGTFTVASEDYKIKSGDVVHIPRGLIHSFVPSDKDTVVVSIFAPKFDPSDRIFVD